MDKLTAYADLAIDKTKQSQTLGDYEDLKPNGAIRLASQSEAIERLFNIKTNLGTLLRQFPKNLMIAGSTPIACVVEDHKFSPNDIDIYMLENDHKAICQIDQAIRSTYKTEVIVVRAQFTINWFIKDADKHNYPTIQLILPPARHWSHVFVSYYCDLVCLGYLVTEKKFIYARGRWDRFYETGVSLGTTSFIHGKYSQKAIDGMTKYRGYGFKIEEVSANDVVVKEKNKLSQRFEIKEAFDNLEAYMRKHPQVAVGRFLHNVYSGEAFKSIIEVYAFFNRCPVCGDVIFRKIICGPCAQRENAQVGFVTGILKRSNKSLKYLVTGGRCGLGAEVSKLLIDCGLDVTITTRFPHLVEGKKTIQLDMRDSNSVGRLEEEISNFDVVILSAAETLHYSHSNPAGDLKNAKLDWKNDFHKDDTGVWHKCLDEHSNEEIQDPIGINIVATTKIIRSFVAHQARGNSQRLKSIVYVTSSEGLFSDKTPYHPIINMTKSAIEQLILTLKRQADVLGMKIVMADPGWLSNRSKNANTAGPITMEWGATQTLMPIAYALSGLIVENGSLWSRKNGGSDNENIVHSTDMVKFKGDGETCPTTLEDSNVMVRLKPCKHQLGLPGWYQLKQTDHREKCPMCRA